ncbi:hypothetical protein niasHT_024130 [Heterodera trifolii]|uniref:Uncharacterized protein n=1 Tax=Heterodera trifolii TaxID=157864 RepID=A0ABD2KQV2_9BILA
MNELSRCKIVANFSPGDEKAEEGSGRIPGRSLGELGFLVFNRDDGTPVELDEEEEDRWGGGARDHPCDRDKDRKKWRG